jgi:hypothetical protein
MKNPWLFSFLLILLLCAFFCGAFGQNIKDIQLGPEGPILNNRAFLAFPSGSKNVARSGGLMSADPSQNQETRIIFDIGKERMVFFAKEEYKLSDGDLFSEVSKSKDQSNFKNQILIDNKQLLSILSTPNVVDSVNDAILINKLVVKTRDNSIFSVGAYISPSAFKDREQFTELSKRVFNTLVKGTRTNNRNAHTESINIFGTKKSFKIKLPLNYTVTVDKKYDFQVIRFHKYTDYIDTNWIDAILYTGGFPWTRYKDLGFDINSSQKIPGKFLDKTIEWMTFFDNKKGVFLREQKIPDDNIEEGLIVYITMESNQKSLIEEVTKIVEGITLSK